MKAVILTILMVFLAGCHILPYWTPLCPKKSQHIFHKIGTCWYSPCDEKYMAHLPAYAFGTCAYYDKIEGIENGEIYTSSCLYRNEDYGRDHKEHNGIMTVVFSCQKAGHWVYNGGSKTDSTKDEMPILCNDIP